MVPFAVRAYWANWRWEWLLVINAAACAILLIALLKVDSATLLPAESPKNWTLMVVGFVMLGTGLLALPYQKHQRRQYEMSPGTWVPMRLDRKWLSPAGRNQPDRRNFLMTDISGTQHRVELFPNSQLFRLAEEGDALQVEMWRGSIVQVRARGLTSETTEYPGSTSGLPRFLAVVLSASGPFLCFGLFVAFSKPN